MSKKMDLLTVKAILDSERSAALAAMISSRLSNERADALDYYMGEMSKDMPASDGRSHAVSSDVADTIDGMMPTLMDIFCSGDEVVRFEPQGPEDVQAAEQETDYVNHVFMQQNPGFLILYSMIKDALLSKVGIVKVRWETGTVEERETYQGLGQDELAYLKADEDVEIVEEEEIKDEPDPNGQEMGEPPVTYNIIVKRSKKYGRTKIEPVPPEEFGISRNARSLRDCDYAFHKVLTTPAKLIAQGFDEHQAENLPAYTSVTNTEEINRDTVNEYQFQGDGLNQTARRIEVTEHYIRMDYEGNGNPCLYMVTTGGVGGEILIKQDGKPAIEPIDMIPLAAMTPVIMTHRFFGRLTTRVLRLPRAWQPRRLWMTYWLAAQAELSASSSPAALIGRWFRTSRRPPSRLSSTWMRFASGARASLVRGRALMRTPSRTRRRRPQIRFSRPLRRGSSSLPASSQRRASVTCSNSCMRPSASTGKNTRSPGCATSGSRSTRGTGRRATI
jgi:hypothetical protein